MIELRLRLRLAFYNNISSFRHNAIDLQKLVDIVQFRKVESLAASNF